MIVLPSTDQVAPTVPKVSLTEPVPSSAKSTARIRLKVLNVKPASVDR